MNLPIPLARLWRARWRTVGSPLSMLLKHVWAPLLRSAGARTRRYLHADEITDKMIDDALEAFRQYGDELANRPERDAA